MKRRASAPAPIPRRYAVACNSDEEPNRRGRRSYVRTEGEASVVTAADLAEARTFDDRAEANELAAALSALERRTFFLFELPYRRADLPAGAPGSNGPAGPGAAAPQAPARAGTGTPKAQSALGRPGRSEPPEAITHAPADGAATSRTAAIDAAGGPSPARRVLSSSPHPSRTTGLPADQVGAREAADG